jgi:hypothetical protein
LSSDEKFIDLEIRMMIEREIKEAKEAQIIEKIRGRRGQISETRGKEKSY